MEKMGEINKTLARLSTKANRAWWAAVGSTGQGKAPLPDRRCRAKRASEESVHGIGEHQTIAARRTWIPSSVGYLAATVWSLLSRLANRVGACSFAGEMRATFIRPSLSQPAEHFVRSSADVRIRIARRNSEVLQSARRIASTELASTKPSPHAGRGFRLQ